MGGKEKLAKAVLDTVTHIHGNGYKGIMTSGRSEVIAVYLFSERWARLYPHESIPLYQLGERGNHILYQNTEIVEDDFMKTGVPSQKRIESLQEYIDRLFPDIERGNTMAFLDERADTGLKLNAAGLCLGYSGFSHIHPAAFVASARVQHHPQIRNIYYATHDEEVSSLLKQLIQAVKDGNDIATQLRDLAGGLI